MLKDYLLLTWRNIRHRQLRALLTIVGITIGIAAIISLVAVSESLQNSIQDQFDRIGTNRFFISAKGGSFVDIQDGLTTDDVKTIEKLTEAKWVTAYLFDTALVEFKNEEHSLAVTGITSEDLDKRWEDIDFNVEQGRMIRDGEKNAAIIGVRVHDTAFDKKASIGNKLLINNVTIKIIGIFEEFGNPEDDNGIFVSLETARELFDDTDGVTFIEVVIKDSVDLEKTAAKAARKLEKDRNNEEFEVITPEQLLDQLNSVLLVVQIVLIGIAAISLVVGAIGIMNSMYTSVLERINEIGLMKAVGAKNSDVLNLFLIESALLGGTGGILGVTLSVIFAQIVTLSAKQAGFAFLQVKVSIPLAIGAIVFAMIIGIVSGVFPARSAALLPPIEALRK
jgi:putative ABC transport system permease protein